MSTSFQELLMKCHKLKTATDLEKFIVKKTETELKYLNFEQIDISNILQHIWRKNVNLKAIGFINITII